MGLVSTIRYNLVNLATFSGRETRAQFWPYAAFVFVLSIAGMMAVMLPEMSASMERMQKFATEHPDMATVQQGPGSYSITTALTSSDTHLADNYEWRDLAFLFIVMNMNRKTFVGTSWIEPTVEIVR